MTERKRRGLGRGLGALINSDGRELEPSGAAAHASSPEVPRETVSESPQDHHGPRDGELQGHADHRAQAERHQTGSGVEEHVPAESTEQDGGSQDDPPEGVAASSESRRPGPSGRPIDVFFSAKSDLGTQRVSRETIRAPRSSTTSRRTGGRRAEMPDVLNERTTSRATPADTASTSVTPRGEGENTAESAGGTSRAVPHEVDGPDSSLDHASAPTGLSWTNGVPRETVNGVDGAEFMSVSVDAIHPNPRQPRQEFDEDELAELIHSVREIGVLQPVVLRPIGDAQYELVMGERRWRASKGAGKSEIPAIVRHTKDDNLLRDALLENIHRSQLNPLEEAAAYRQLLDDFSCTQDELAARIGRSRPQISNTLRLMKLPPAVQRRVAAGVLSSGHARALLGMSNPEEMEELARRIVAEGLSVRATEESVAVAQREGGRNGVSRGTTSRLPSTARYQQLDEYADALTDRLDTQVKITLGAKKGRIAIDFGSIEDLHRLMEMIGDPQRVG